MQARRRCRRGRRWPWWAGRRASRSCSWRRPWPGRSTRSSCSPRTARRRRSPSPRRAMRRGLSARERARSRGRADPSRRAPRFSTTHVGRSSTSSSNMRAAARRLEIERDALLAGVQQQEEPGVLAALVGERRAARLARRRLDLDDLGARATPASACSWAPPRTGSGRERESRRAPWHGLDPPSRALGIGFSSRGQLVGGAGGADRRARPAPWPICSAADADARRQRPCTKQPLPGREMTLGDQHVVDDAGRTSGVAAASSHDERAPGTAHGLARVHQRVLGEAAGAAAHQAIARPRRR